MDKKSRKNLDAELFRQSSNAYYPTLLGFITFWWTIRASQTLTKLLEDYYSTVFVNTGYDFDTGFFNFLSLLLAYLLYVLVMYTYKKNYKKLTQKSSSDDK